MFGSLRAAFALGLLTYLTLSGTIHWRILLRLLSNWPFPLLALFVCLVFSLVQAQRLSLLFRAQSMSLPLSSSFKLTLIGLFFNTCLPGATGGDAIKIYYAIEGNGGRRTEIATLILFDRLVGMFALVNLPVLAALLFPKLYGSFGILKGLVWTSAAVSLVMVAGTLLCLIRRPKDSTRLLAAFERIPLGTYLKRALDTLYDYRYSKGILLSVVGISLLGHAMNVLVILLLAKVLDPPGLGLEMSLLIPLGFLALALPVSPGGLGIGEAAFSSLFALAGLKGGADLLLGWRILFFLVGLSGVFFYFEGRKRFVQDFGFGRAPGANLRSQEEN